MKRVKVGAVLSAIFGDETEAVEQYLAYLIETKTVETYELWNN